MERGKKAARDLLMEIRARAYKWDRRGRAAGLAAVGALLAAAIPESENAQTDFFLVLAEYLVGALTDFPPDLEDL